MRRIKCRDLAQWGACCRKPGERYDPDALRKRLGDARFETGLTLPEILRLHWVPDEDKVWLCCHAMSAAERKAWLDLIVSRAIKTHALHCGIPSVEIWAQSWLSGADRSKAAARDAAEAAARAARAAPAAAWDAAWDAAWAAWAAADAADAADAAGDVGDVRDAAEWCLQVRDALRVLKAKGE